MRRSLLCTFIALGALVAASAPVAAKEPRSASAPATVTGPVTGGAGHPSLVSTAFELSGVGYVANEYFLDGTATAYAAAKPLTSDGKWKVKPVSTAPYKTRIVVYRPENPKDFNGTVVVEWLNVTAGFDTSPHWQAAHNAIVRAGAAWVGVSAQEVGIKGTSTGAFVTTGIKGADPARYGTLDHPGDIYSYDIFSQAGRAVTGGGKSGPLGGLPVKRVIAVGESQSASRLTTYVDAVHPLAHVYDGFLIQSRGAGASNLTQAPPTAPGAVPVSLMPNPTKVRTDINVPVLTLQSEFDTANARSGGYFTARQPDTKKIRAWEVAGTAHADNYTPPGVGVLDTGDGKAEAALIDPTQLTGGAFDCLPKVNVGGFYLVANAAISQLDRWVRDGTPASRGPRIDVTAGTAGQLPTINRDEHGNALGGVRTPIVDAPVSTLSGDGGGSISGGRFCGLYGTTVPFDAATLAALYPTHADYVAKFNEATDKAVKAGFIAAPEAKNLKAAAAASSVGNPG